ncbi:NAD(P)-binding oxidoreductase [Aquipuribacter sp. MA13-6]|uniref:NAD(P)-binding oxidoreductase n=1 Tax=unclassified Aquipuribacter TaxID=2635084 RepID=UPI003EEB03E0
MKVVIAGGHGAIARLSTRRLVADGHEVVGMVRNPDHVPDLVSDGAGAVVIDLETARTAQVAEALAGADAVVFAAGAGPGSGVARKDTVDRGAAVLLAEAAELAGVATYLLISSMGVDQVRDGATPDGVDDVFLAYLRAKLAAEEDVLARDALRSLVLRPGGLTDDDATERVQLARSVEMGQVPRDDVAAVVVELLGRAEAGTTPSRLVVECVGGPTPVAEAVDQVIGPV